MNMNRFNDVVSHNLKEFISPSEFTHVNELRISKANSLDHELRKAELFVKCVHSGLNVLTEPILSDKKIGRPDILVLDTLPCIAYEIVKSEKEDSLIRKDKDYPFIVKVVIMDDIIDKYKDVPVKEKEFRGDRVGFWIDYDRADYFERKELLKKLPMLKSLIRQRKNAEVDDELFEYEFYSYIQSYIDDLICSKDEERELAEERMALEWLEED